MMARPLPEEGLHDMGVSELDVTSAYLILIALARWLAAVTNSVVSCAASTFHQ